MSTRRTIPRQDPPWLDREELAERLGVHPRTIQRHLAAGRFPHHRIGIRRDSDGPDNRPVLFSPEDVATIETLFVERVPGEAS